MLHSFLLHYLSFFLRPCLSVSLCLHLRLSVSLSPSADLLIVLFRLHALDISVRIPPASLALLAQSVPYTALTLHNMTIDHIAILQQFCRKRERERTVGLILCS